MNDSNIKITFTLIDKLAEMEIALNNEMYISALTLALAIPDILGKYEVEKMQTKSGDNNMEKKGSKYRYVTWCKNNLELPPLKHVMKNNNENLKYIEETQSLYIEKIYKLRCAFLHENTTKDTDKKYSFAIIFTEGGEDNNTLSIAEFCHKIEDAAINYLKMHKELINKEQEQKNILNFSDDEALSQKLQEEMKFYLDDIFENKEESKNEN